MALNVVERLGSVFRGADLEANLSVLAINMAAKVCDGHSAPCCFPAARLAHHAMWRSALCWPLFLSQVTLAKIRKRLLHACSNMTGTQGEAASASEGRHS